MELRCWTELATWDIMPWIYFVHCWPFVRGIHWSLVFFFLHKGPSSQVDPPYQRPVMQSFFFVHSLNIPLNKESISWWFETPWCSCDIKDWTFEPCRNLHCVAKQLAPGEDLTFPSVLHSRYSRWGLFWVKGIHWVLPEIIIGNICLYLMYQITFLNGDSICNLTISIFACLQKVSM